MGNRSVLLISRSTLTLASDRLLRFVLRHDLGHQRYHHNLLSTLAGWAWVVIGLALSDRVIPARWGYNTAVFASPLYIAFLALTISAWMAIGEPVLAYLGRRLEYQADRFYLRNGGNLEEMRSALEELAHQNLARTEQMGRRETIFHPLPSIANRLHAAREYEAKLSRIERT
jgi:Zn-dependent protease with chaperone function